MRGVQCGLRAALLGVFLCGAVACRSQPEGEWLELSSEAQSSFEALRDQLAQLRALPSGDPERSERAVGLLAQLDAWIEAEPGFFRAEVARQDLLLDIDPERAQREYAPGAWNQTARRALLVARFLWSEPEQAQEWIGLACQIEPGLAWAWYARGALERDRSHWTEALESVEKAVALDQWFPEAERLRAEVLEVVGDREATIDAWRRLLKIDANDLEARHRYARTLLLSDDPDDAQRAENSLWKVREALLAMPNPPEELLLAATNDLGVAITRQGRHQEALRWFREALLVRRGDLRALYNLGWTLEKLGQDQRALEAYEAYARRAQTTTDPLLLADTQDSLLYVPDHIRRLREKLDAEAQAAPQDGAPPVVPPVVPDGRP